MKEHTYPIMFRVEQSHWWYAGRRKILSEFVEEICREVTDRRPRILDVGCGTGANLLMLSKYGEAEGVDVSEDALAFCRERGLDKVRLGNGEELPYEAGTFDLVTAFDVVEHMDDDLAGLREMRRVLRPGGRALLFVPTFMFLWGLQDDVVIIAAGIVCLSCEGCSKRRDSRSSARPTLTSRSSCPSCWCEN